jgi:hypothetical protein
LVVGRETADIEDDGASCAVPVEAIGHRVDVVGSAWEGAFVESLVS